MEDATGFGWISPEQRRNIVSHRENVIMHLIENWNLFLTLN